MGNEDTAQKEDTDQRGEASRQESSGDDVERYDSGQIAEKPEPSDEQKKNAEEMAKSYVEDRPTTVLPGSDSTVTGTAVNDWIDDEGNPVHGDVHDDRQEAAERDRERNERARKPDDDSGESGNES